MKFLKSALLLIVWSIPVVCFSTEGKIHVIKTVLVTARPVSADFIHDNSTPATIIAPMTFKVKLTDIKVIQGDSSEFPSTATVELLANHKEALLRYARIYLLMDVSNKKPLVLYWENVISMACIPEKLVDQRYRDFYFVPSWQSSSPDTRCTFVRTYVEPPMPN